MLLINQVASATTANVVDRGGVLTETLLLGKFLVEAEHGTFALAVDISGSTSASGEVGVGGRRSELDARGRASGGAAVSYILGVDAGHVAGSTAARVVDICGGGRWVRLGDVEGDHFGCWW